MGVCKLAFRCHVAGKGLTTFGTKFTQARVLEAASSSVLLIDAGASIHVASGVLLSQSVLLCAAHSIVSASTNLQGLLLFECNSTTASALPTSQGPLPPPCTPLRTVPQIKIGKVLENGQKYGLDYVLFAISWINNQTTFERTVTLPKPDYFYGGELLATGHPVKSYKGDPTQASAGTHFATAMHGPHPDPKTAEDKAAKEYTYASFVTADGMSGGGVFNEKGNLIGIVTGYKKIPEGNGYAFLNLGLVAGKTVTSGGTTKPVSERLKKWMGGGQPLLPGDPQPATGLTFTPAL